MDLGDLHKPVKAMAMKARTIGEQTRIVYCQTILSNVLVTYLKHMDKTLFLFFDRGVGVWGSYLASA